MLRRLVLSWSLPLGLLIAAEGDWQKKKTSEWSQGDIHELLTDSPWAKTTTPEYKANSGQGRGLGRAGIGIGAGGIGIGNGGAGGGGMGRRGGGGMGMPGGNGQQQQQPRPTTESGSTNNSGERDRNLDPIVVRWESALPIQEAELKSRNGSAPTMDEERYAIVVSGLPSRIIQNDKLAKPKGELRREGQKTIKSVEARVLPRDDGALVIFYFSRTKEITPNDKTIEFDGEVGPFHLKQTFTLADMVYQGKLEL